ncbi:MAG: hypothetical protein U5K54_26135 [Cytophagales bacterium]|nr:hypothetical protein [Cytophagales bacterium]
MKSFIALKLALLVVFFASCTTNQNNEKIDNQNYIKPDLKNLIGHDFLIDDQHSYIGFRIEYFGNSKVRGRFDEFNGTVFYDSSSKQISSTLIIRDCQHKYRRTQLRQRS